MVTSVASDLIVSYPGMFDDVATQMRSF